MPITNEDIKDAKLDLEKKRKVASQKQTAVAQASFDVTEAQNSLNEMLIQQRIDSLTGEE